jgi:hypothetical protein
MKSQPTLYQTLNMASPASQHPKKSTWPGKTQRHNRESRVGNPRRGKGSMQKTVSLAAFG